MERQDEKSFESIPVHTNKPLRDKWYFKKDDQHSAPSPRIDIEEPDIPHWTFLKLYRTSPLCILVNSSLSDVAAVEESNKVSSAAAVDPDVKNFNEPFHGWSEEMEPKCAMPKMIADKRARSPDLKGSSFEKARDEVLADSHSGIESSVANRLVEDDSDADINDLLLTSDEDETVAKGKIETPISYQNDLREINGKTEQSKVNSNTGQVALEHLNSIGSIEVGVPLLKETSSVGISKTDLWQETIYSRINEKTVQSKVNSQTSQVALEQLKSIGLIQGEVPSPKQSNSASISKADLQEETKNSIEELLPTLDSPCKTKNAQVKRKHLKRTQPKASKRKQKKTSERMKFKILGLKRRRLLNVRRTCRKCLKKSSTYSMNIDHEQLEHPNICQICTDEPFSFICESDLKCHTEEMHSDESLEEFSQKNSDGRTSENIYLTKNVNEDVVVVAVKPKLLKRNYTCERVKKEDVKNDLKNISNRNGNTSVDKYDLNNKQTVEEESLRVKREHVDFNKNDYLPDDRTLKIIPSDNMIKTESKPRIQNRTGWKMEEIGDCNKLAESHNSNHDRANQPQQPQNKVTVPLSKGAVIDVASLGTVSIWKTSSPVQIEASSSAESPKAGPVGIPEVKMSQPTKEGITTNMRDGMIQQPMRGRGGLKTRGGSAVPLIRGMQTGHGVRVHAAPPRHPSMAGVRAPPPKHPSMPGARAPPPMRPSMAGARAPAPMRPGMPGALAPPPRHPSMPRARAAPPRHPSMFTRARAAPPRHPSMFRAQAPPRARAPPPRHPSMPRARAPPPRHPSMPRVRAPHHRPPYMPRAPCKPQLLRGGVRMREVPRPPFLGVHGGAGPSAVPIRPQPEYPKQYEHPKQISAARIPMESFVPVDPANKPPAPQPKIIKLEPIDISDEETQPPVASNDVLDHLDRLEACGISVTRNKTPTKPKSFELPLGISLSPASMSSQVSKE